MNQSILPTTDRQVLFEVLGFDRPHFISDVLEAASVPGRISLCHLSFEADGVRTVGWFTIQVNSPVQLNHINQQLQTIQGLVRVTQRLLP